MYKNITITKFRKAKNLRPKDAFFMAGKEYRVVSVESDNDIDRTFMEFAQTTGDRVILRLVLPNNMKMTVRRTKIER